MLQFVPEQFTSTRCPIRRELLINSVARRLEPHRSPDCASSVSGADARRVVTIARFAGAHDGIP